MTTAAHECITELLGLLDDAARRPAESHHRGLASELRALAEAAEVAGCAPETDALLSGDALELADLARSTADALASAPSSRAALAA